MSPSEVKLSRATRACGQLVDWRRRQPKRRRTGAIGVHFLIGGNGNGNGNDGGNNKPMVGASSQQSPAACKRLELRLQISLRRLTQHTRASIKRRQRLCSVSWHSHASQSVFFLWLCASVALGESKGCGASNLAHPSSVSLESCRRRGRRHSRRRLRRKWQASRLRRSLQRSVDGHGVREFSRTSSDRSSDQRVLRCESQPQRRHR